MPGFINTPAPVETLWGTPQTADERLPGVWFVTTGSHGGFVLSDERQAAMPESLRLEDRYYEEDVNWALVVMALEKELRQAGDALIDIELPIAQQTVQNWLPARYQGFTGIVLEPRDSHILRRKAEYEANLGEIIVTAAWGDWADWVPKGKVGVVRQKLSAVSHLAQPIYEGPQHKGLVDQERYDSARINSFASLGVITIP